MSTAYNLSVFTARVAEIGEWLKKELATIRSGRATPALLDRVLVPSYGQRVELRQLGSVAMEDARRLKINLWDKTQTKEVETALNTANLGVSVGTEGDAVVVTFPELTTEKRELLTKTARAKMEEAKISLRQERDKHWKEIQEKERGGELTEDDKFRLKEKLQKTIDSATAEFELVGKKKEAEILN